MKPLYFFCGLSLLLASKSFAEDNLGKIKYQVESSFDITKEAAIKIINHYEFEKKERIDYVFDSYEGEKFLLFPGKNKIRFRMKEDENKRVLQINTTYQFINRQCQNGQTVIIREKENGEINLSNEQANYLRTRNNIWDILKNDTENSILEMKNLDKYLKEIYIPLKPELEKSFPKTWIYLPINISKKKKYKYTINFGSGDIIVSISGGQDYIGKKFIQEKWELEFQVNPKDWIDFGCKTKYCSFEKSICTFLKNEKLTAKDFDPPKISPYEILKKELMLYKKDLGLTK